jgi:hypothetical protein
MKTIVKVPGLVFLFIWELPQILLGSFVFIFMKIRRRIVKTEKYKHRFFIETINTGVSLGWFVFWTPNGNRYYFLKDDCRMHEFGHAKQSAMLGPLYLLLVGIPSASRAIYGKWYRKRYGQNWDFYFDGFPEYWADRLGGVTNPRRSDFREQVK